MQQHNDLYTVRANALSNPHLKGLPLIIAFGHPQDAGNTAINVADNILDKLDHVTIVEFDSDELHDYRLRRPPIHFAGDQFESPSFPKLELYALEDELGQPFLLLAGVEPDLKWKKFSEAVLDILTDLEVSLAVIVTGFANSVPHTRQLPVTAHGSRKDLIKGINLWKPVVDVPSSVSSILASRIEDAGIDTVGFSINVPQYLAEAELPQSALLAMEHISRVTKLALPKDRLLEAAQSATLNINKQVSENPDIAEMVRRMEEHYDRNIGGVERAENSFGAQEMKSIPPRDEIARTIEDYLSHFDESPGDEEPGNQ